MKWEKITDNGNGLDKPEEEIKVTPVDLVATINKVLIRLNDDLSREMALFESAKVGVGVVDSSLMMWGVSGWKDIRSAGGEKLSLEVD